MKKSILIVFVIMLSISINILFTNKVFAKITKAWNYDQCLSESGASGITGVQTACRQWVDDRDQNCTIWIGTRSSSTLSVETTGSTATAYFYGMCIAGPYGDETSGAKANRIEIKNDNGSIALPPKATQTWCDNYVTPPPSCPSVPFSTPTINRGPWGNPTATKTTINVAKFISGITGVESGNYTKYTRKNVRIYRCFYSSNSCGPQYVDITLSIPNTTLKLTADAVTPNGTVLKSSFDSASKTVPKGNSASLSVSSSKYAPSGYVFKGWRTNKTSGTPSGGNTYTKSISSNTTVYAVYEPTGFGGKSELSGDTSATAGYTNKTTTKIGTISNCSPITGCQVSFKHYLKTNSGSGKTSYTVSRTSNLTTTGKGIANNPSVATGTNGTSDGVEVSSSGPFTLYPGMVVCERLTFKPDSASGTANVYTQVCASALGDAQPSGDDNLLNIKVRNESVEAYNTFRNSVYAKPGDKLEFQTTYSPLLQYTYHLIPQKMQSDSGTGYPSSENNTTKTLGTMFNENKGNLGDWNNAYSVYSTSLSLGTQISNDHTFELGNQAPDDRNKSNEYNVSSDDAGKNLKETAETNRNDTVKTTPKQVTFTNSSDSNLANIITDKISSTASALVPYNFINTTEIKDEEDNVVYAGESKLIKINIAINPKTNSLTTDGSEEEKYATSVKNAKWGIRLCIIRENSEDCSETNSENDSNHGDIKVSPEESKSTKTIEKSLNIKIPDIVAGSDICLNSFIYPRTSGADDNLDSNGDGETAYSERKCFKVAKRPSLQAWGGNIYTRGNILLTESEKYHLAGYNDYSIEIGENEKPHTFGSWGELGIIATGMVRGLSSGAGTGYQINNNGSLFPKYDFGSDYNGIGNNSEVSEGEPLPGGNIGDFCSRSPLSFANSMCSNGATGSLSSATASNNASSDKESILRKFIYAGEKVLEVSGEITINEESMEGKMITVDGEEDSNVYYYHASGDLTLNASEISKGIIIVTSPKGNIEINGNQIYSGTFNSLNELPKLVIYANNVNINCNVERIDALIIANDKVRTCSDSSNINNIENSTQLKVNGAIISNNLEANRTYGASTGANSIIPAEIINFDPTLYKWGDITKAGDDDDDETEITDPDSTLDVVYIKETAPRT